MKLSAKKNSKDNLKMSLILGVIAMICAFIRLGGPILGAITAIFGLKYGKRAAKEGKPLAILSLILNVIPLFYLLAWLFILGYAFTSR